MYTLKTNIKNQDHYNKNHLKYRKAITGKTKRKFL